MSFPGRFNAYFLAKAYTTAYALCYMVAPLSGLYILQFGSWRSHLVLFMVGVGLLMTVHIKNTQFIYLMAAFEALGCVAHFYGVIQWVPALNTTGYLLMSMLDLVQGIFLLILIEYKHAAIDNMAESFAPIQ